jgi:hypothetical protein
MKRFFQLAERTRLFQKIDHIQPDRSPRRLQISKPGQDDHLLLGLVARSFSNSSIPLTPGRFRSRMKISNLDRLHEPHRFFPGARGGDLESPRADRAGQHVAQPAFVIDDQNPHIRRRQRFGLIH